MATTKPRITVTLDPDVYGTLRNLAAMQERSISSLIAETMDMVHPVNKRVLEIATRASRAQQKSKESFRNSLTEAEKSASKMAGDLFEMLDQMAASEGGQPPHSNTGVTLDSPPPSEMNRAPGKSRSRASGGKK
jgi:hypothetical protein